MKAGIQGSVHDYRGQYACRMDPDMEQKTSESKFISQQVTDPGKSIYCNQFIIPFPFPDLRIALEILRFTGCKIYYRDYNNTCSQDETEGFCKVIRIQTKTAQWLWKKDEIYGNRNDP